MSDTEKTKKAPPAASPAPVTPVPAGQPVTIPPSSTMLPAGTDYEAKYNGLRGAFGQAQAAWQERNGALEQQVQLLQTEAGHLKEKLSTAEANATKLTEQVSELPALHEQADKVTGLEAQGQRLEMILRYPEIVGKTEMVDTSEEGEDEVFERVNPFLDALLSSTLTGDAFRALAEGMAGQLGTGEWTEGEVKKPPGQQPGGAPPPSPVPSGSLEDLRKQALEAQRAGDYDKANSLWDAVSAKRAKG